MKSKTFFSEFGNGQNKDIAVGIICKDDSRYEFLKSQFELYGYGFTDTKIGCIFIDGEAGLSEAELKWVEAHEAAHINLKHKMGDRNEEDEFEADLFAKLYLWRRGYYESAELVDKHLKERHGDKLQN